jgi:hypothetical protein
VLEGLSFAAPAVGSWLASGKVTRLVVDGPDAGSGAPFDHAAVRRGCQTTCPRPAACSPVDSMRRRRSPPPMRAASPAGVDVSSGVERARGVKDHREDSTVIDAVRMTDRATNA